MAQLASAFESRGVKMLLMSCDTPAQHHAWAADIRALVDVPELPYPILSDPTREVASKLGMLDPHISDGDGMPLTVRGVFIIGPDLLVRAITYYPLYIGRGFYELLRAIDALQLAEKGLVATPDDWRQGEPVLISPKLSTKEALARFPGDVSVVNLPSSKSYLRITSGTASS